MIPTSHCEGSVVIHASIAQTEHQHPDKQETVLEDLTQEKITNLCLFAPHADVLTLSFREMVPSLLFGGRMVHGHYLLDWSGKSAANRARIASREGEQEE